MRVRGIERTLAPVVPAPDSSLIPSTCHVGDLVIKSLILILRPIPGFIHSLLGSYVRTCSRSMSSSSATGTFNPRGTLGVISICSKIVLVVSLKAYWSGGNPTTFCGTFCRPTTPALEKRSPCDTAGCENTDA